MAVDAKGKVFSGDRNTLNLPLKPDTVPRVRQAGFRVITSMDLPPGRYQLRIAAREANGRRAGSVLVRRRGAGLREGAAVDEQPGADVAGHAASRRRRVRRIRWRSCCPAPLTSYRDFLQNDEIALFAEVYEAAPGPSHKVEINLTMKAEGGQTVFQSREERDSSELGGSGGGYGFSARVPLQGHSARPLRAARRSAVADRRSADRLARNDRERLGRRRAGSRTTAAGPPAPLHRRTCGPAPPAAVHLRAPAAPAPAHRRTCGTCAPAAPHRTRRTQSHLPHLPHLSR